MTAAQYAPIQAGQAAASNEPGGDVSRQIKELRREIDMLEGVVSQLIARIGPVLSEPVPTIPGNSLEGIVVQPAPPTTVVGGDICAAQDRLCRLRQELIVATGLISI